MKFNDTVISVADNTTADVRNDTDMIYFWSLTTQ